MICMKDEQYRWVKVIVIVVLFILGYLFVLNGRYEPVGQNGIIIFDKWTQKAILPDDYME